MTAWEPKSPYRAVRPRPATYLPEEYHFAGAIDQSYYSSPVARQALSHLSGGGDVSAFSVPWYKGFCVPGPEHPQRLRVPGIAVRGAGERGGSREQQSEMTPATLLARIGMIVSYGWAVTVVILITALVTLNLTNRRGVLITPPWGLCAALLVFSLAGSSTVATASAVLARYFSAAGAKSILRAFFLLVLLVLAFSSRLLPDSWQFMLSDLSTRRAIARLAWEASPIAVVLTGLFLVPLTRRPAKAQSRGTDPV